MGGSGCSGRVQTISETNHAEEDNRGYHSVVPVDNIVFENAGCGFHLYGQAPQLSGLYLEGNISFATSLNPRCPSKGEINILTGGSKPITHLVLKNNCTYHPDPASKRGVDVGFHGSPNTDIRIENNYFTCAANAMELKGAAMGIWARKCVPKVRKPTRNTAWMMLDIAVVTPQCTLARLRAGMPTLVGAPKVPPMRFPIP
jgi:hypothetical protein